MKHHPAWLASGLLLFAVIACNLSKNGNSSANKRSISDSAVHVDRINMAKDDNGQPGESTSTFSPDERTVQTVVVLNHAKEGTKVKWVWVAADAAGFPKNQELKSAEFVTGPEDTNVHGHLTWSKDWPPGQYRAEIYINGVLDKTINYSVK